MFLVIDSLVYLTVAGQAIAIAVLVLLLLSFAGSYRAMQMRRWIAAHALTLTFIVALVATGGSLFFSEIAYFVPCKLCWFQRITMYPQVILIALGLYYKDKNVIRYVLALSVIGMAIATYHYGEQWMAMLYPAEIDPLAPCDLSGVSCRATYIFELGYITIPSMALTAFVLNILGSVCMLMEKKIR